jgi:hypothetical protein
MLLMNGAPRKDLALRVTFVFAAALLAAILPMLACSGARAQEHGGCKDGFCWEVYPPSFNGETLVKITKWPWRKSTHRNIIWDCESGGCQLEGDALHLPKGASGAAHQVSVQACIRHRIRRSKCSAWTSFIVR